MVYVVKWIQVDKASRQSQREREFEFVGSAEKFARELRARDTVTRAWVCERF